MVAKLMACFAGLVGALGFLTVTAGTRPMMTISLKGAGAAALLLLAISSPVRAGSPGGGQWVGSWASSQQPAQLSNAAPGELLRGGTLRQIVHLSAGGAMIRLRVSNAFGSSPLHLIALHVARHLSPAASRIDPASDVAVTFDQRADVLIPAGAEYTSDPVNYRAVPLADLAVTMQFEAPPERQTGHPGSRATSYLVAAAPVSAAEMPAATQTMDHWYFLSGVDASVESSPTAIVTLGDSITDGHGATTNGNDRWPDVLAARLQHSAHARSIGVLNEGIGGNRVLLDGTGPNALARFDRDVLVQNGVRYFIVLEGINDIGNLTRTQSATEAQHAQLVRSLIGAYQQMIQRAHAHGIKAIGGTITPFTGSDFYHPDAANESDRTQVNAWIRGPGHFDAAIDFDKTIADPAHPQRMLANYDSGDHLHPSAAGYRAMADAISLALFQN
jgi:lysophospholipase L1-like esterase